MTTVDNAAPRNVIVRIKAGSPAWWDLVHAVRDAESRTRDLSVSIDRTGRGDIVVAFRVGNGDWSAHQRTAQAPRHDDAVQS